MFARSWSIATGLGLTFLVSSMLAGELPRLIAHGADPEGRYANTYGMSCVGRITPAFSTDVRIEVFHVLDDGGLIRQFASSFNPRESGRFSTTFEPPATNWLPGKTRMRVSLTRLPQVFSEVDFMVLGDPVVLPNVTPIYLPKATDLVIKLPFEEVKTYEMPPQATCLVEGTLQSKREFSGIEGPRDLSSLIRIRDDALRVTYHQRLTPSFKQPDGTYWYQLQLKSPAKPGLYHMELKSFVSDAVPDDAFGTSELPFSIRVVEDGDALRP